MMNKAQAINAAITLTAGLLSSGAEEGYYPLNADTAKQIAQFVNVLAEELQKIEGDKSVPTPPSMDPDEVEAIRKRNEAQQEFLNYGLENVYRQSDF